LDATALKFVPLITTLIPDTPDEGENELIVGCEKRGCANIKKERKVETRLKPLIAIIMLGFGMIIRIYMKLNKISDFEVVTILA